MSRYSPWPDKAFVQLRYCDEAQFSIGVGQLTNFRVYRVNSINDPSAQTETDTRPRGYNQWATMYNRYRVYGCKVVFTMWTESTIQTNETSTNGIIWIAPRAASDASPAPGSGAVMEDIDNLRGVTRKYVSNYAGSRVVNHLTRYFSVKSVEGQRSGDERDFSGSMGVDTGTNPFIMPTFWIGYTKTGENTAIATRGYMIVRITYYAKLYNPTTAAPLGTPFTA